MAKRKPSVLCVEGEGWEPCRGCGEQPELAPAPLGSVMARCFTEGCPYQGKGESGWQLADEWQSSNKEAKPQ